LTVPSGEGAEYVVLVDPTEKVMSVYGIEPQAGEIRLKSVRNVYWDLKMDEFFDEHSPFAFQDMAGRMVERDEGPDFISIDGAEGGTGAAPLTFADHVALPFKIGFQRVFPIFQQAGLSKDITWIGSGKLGFPDRAIVALTMGCDVIQVAREAMLAIGCIQAQKCHTGHCPAGVATQNAWLQAGLNVEDKAKRFSAYVKGFRKEMITLSLAAGYRHPSQFTGDDIEFSAGVNRFSTLADVLDYRADPVSSEDVMAAVREAEAVA